MRSAYGKGWNCRAQSTVTPFKRLIKLFLLLLVSFHLLAFGPGESQVVTLAFKDAPLQKVFTEIRKQTGYSFAYSETDLSTAKRVNINITNTRIQDALSVLFQNQPLTYTIIERVIIIKAKSEKKINQEQSSLQAFQPIKVFIRVTNEEGDPVAGVTVMVKGTQSATATNADGTCFIITNPNATLVFTAVNILPVEAQVNGKSQLFIQVKGKTGKLDEVQVVAYSTSSQRLNTGNVAVVKASDIEKQPVNNPLLALQGRVPGLTVIQENGIPGGGITVRIQGQNSLNSGNDPLYIIDGVPFSSQMMPSLPAGYILGISGSSSSTLPEGMSDPVGNPLALINPLDIESISVLKDADATAIYGSRAANGAIIITTKKGKSGQTRIDVNLKTGWGKVSNRIKLLNTTEYLMMREAALKNNALIPSNDPFATQPDIYSPDLMIWGSNRNTDWQKELIGNTARMSVAQITVSGGGNNIQYLVGLGLNKEGTVFPGDFDNTRTSIHFNLTNGGSNNRFHFQVSGNYSTMNNRLPTKDLTYDAITLPPNSPELYDSYGQLNWAQIASGSDSISTWRNPLAYLKDRYRNLTTSIIGNANIGYSIFNNLEIKTNFGFTSLNTDEIATSPLSTRAPEERPFQVRSSSFGYGVTNTWIIEPQLHYKANGSFGKLELLVGSTFQETNSKRTQLSAQGFNNDLVLEDIKSATTLIAGESLAATYKYNAIFGRITYNWEDKYILNLSGRRDGSSRFGSKNLISDFGSVAAAWIFSKERLFLQSNRIFSFGKIRLSYGTVGNDQIGDYKFLNLYRSTTNSIVALPYQGAIGMIPVGLPNPYLAWEETKKLQVGLDLGFLNDKLLVTANYAHNRSSNQLVSYSLPIVTGASSVTKNFPALVQNTSFEFALNSTIIRRKKIGWTSNFNLTVPRNKLIDFPDIETSGYDDLVVGQSLNVRKLYHFIGVDTETGIYKFSDKDGNSTSTPNDPDDRTVLINPDPKYYGGFQNSIQLNQFSIDLLITFAKQFGTYSVFGLRPGEFESNANTQARGNQPIEILGAWNKPGDISNIQQYQAIYSDEFAMAYNAANSSDAIFMDASYIRLKNLSISWNFPIQFIKKLKIQKASVYALGQNLYTITKYKGMDPETRNSFSLPPLRMITLGIQVTL